VNARSVGACVLVAAAAYIEYAKAPAPLPPQPDGPIVLRGKFNGDPAEDAAIIASLFSEIADEMEWDGQRAEPMFKTGAAMDALRTRAREMRCRGTKLGDKHPSVRDAIHKYLDESVGVDGGPLTQEQRSKWVTAYRMIARAADAAR
jgi:hypothetical protein